MGRASQATRQWMLRLMPRCGTIRSPCWSWVSRRPGRSPMPKLVLLRGSEASTLQEWARFPRPWDAKQDWHYLLASGWPLGHALDKTPSQLVRYVGDLPRSMRTGDDFQLPRSDPNAKTCIHSPVEQSTILSPYKPGLIESIS